MAASWPPKHDDLRDHSHRPSLLVAGRPRGPAQGSGPSAQDSQPLGRGAMAALLEIRDVNKSFDSLQALVACSFQVEAGEILGVIGPNGSGKTTLFNLIAGFLPPDGGRI